MNTRELTASAIILVLVIAFGAVGSHVTGASQDPEPRLAEASVDSIGIRMAESFPVRVFVSAKGNLPDGCTKVSGVRTVFNDDTFFTTITTARPADAVCTQALVPFDEDIELDVFGLLLGTYTVDVNGVTDTFTFDFDNVLRGGGKG